jgi:hypothetical protein
MNGPWRTACFCRLPCLPNQRYTALATPVLSDLFLASSPSLSPPPLGGEPSETRYALWRREAGTGKWLDRKIAL